MNHEYRATIVWTAEGDVLKGQYTRGHDWEFDGATVRGSASPQVVPAPYSVEKAVDPEEAFVAALSSCHMLFFIDLARRAGFAAASYRDEAVGLMTTEGGRTWVSRVDLFPQIVWQGEAPSAEKTAELHEKAHRLCFIANSVKTEVVVN
jgi:organic hydroperoxide reductase OsmC/OhrA